MTIGNGKQIPILHTGAKFFPSPIKIFQWKVFHVPNLTILISFVFQNFALITIIFLNFILDSFLPKIRLQRRTFCKAILNVACTNFLQDFFLYLQPYILPIVTSLPLPRLNFDILILAIVLIVFWNMFSHLVISLSNVVNTIFVVLVNMHEVIDYLFLYLHLELLILLL